MHLSLKSDGLSVKSAAGRIAGVLFTLAKSKYSLWSRRKYACKAFSVSCLLLRIRAKMCLASGFESNKENAVWAMNRKCNVVRFLSQETRLQCRAIV